MKSSDLIFEYIDGHTWKLYVDFTWKFEDGTILLVPEGFVSDKHSAPRLFWSLVPPTEYAEAAIVHDWLYSKNETKWSRKESDEMYLEMLRVLGAGFVRRYTMYYAVRLFGGRAWKK